MRRRSAGLAATLLAAVVFTLTACSSTGTSVGIYGGVGYYDDPWYWGGCCVDPPSDIGPPRPRPEHPIADPPPARPSHPIAPAPRPTPMPRAAAMPRGGGGRR